MEAKSKKARTLLHVAVVLGTITTAAIVAACSSEETKTEEEKKGDIGYSQLNPVGGSAEAQSPLDAVPSPDGKDVYFIAFATQAGPDGLGTVRVPAIFKAVQGAAPVKLHEGQPLMSPFNITISDDGQRLFIADSSADGDVAEGAERSDGRVFTMGIGGGTPTALAGTEGISPAGIEAMGDSLYITGRKDGLPGVFKTGTGGGAVSVVKSGAPFTDPGGVAVSRKGEIYVVDTGSATAGQSLASVVRVMPDGATEVIADGFSVGHPAGIALTQDESAVLVSGLDGAEGTDRVFRVQLGDRSLAVFKGPIGEFYESAGLHRARNADVLAWADSHANGTGTVYVLKP